MAGFSIARKNDLGGDPLRTKTEIRVRRGVKSIDGRKVKFYRVWTCGFYPNEQERGLLFIGIPLDCLWERNLREFPDGLDMLLGGFEPTAHGVKRKMSGAFGLPIAHGRLPGFGIARAVGEARLQADFAARAPDFLEEAVEQV